MDKKISKELLALKNKFIISHNEGALITKLLYLTSKGVKVILNEKKEIYDVHIPFNTNNKVKLIEKTKEAYYDLIKLEECKWG